MPRLITIALLLLASLPARARQADLTVSDPWMRALAGGLPAAGYFTLANHSGQPVLLVGARSAACGSLTLHQTVRQHAMSAMSGMDPQDAGHGMPGMSMMQPVAALPVPAHGMVRFTPGSYHLMCGHPTDAVQPGRSVQVTLLFESGRTLDAAFAIRDARGR